LGLLAINVTIVSLFANAIQRPCNMQPIFENSRHSPNAVSVENKQRTRSLTLVKSQTLSKTQLLMTNTGLSFKPFTLPMGTSTSSNQVICWGLHALSLRMPGTN
jgi:hypothetical protein